MSKTKINFTTIGLLVLCLVTVNGLLIADVPNFMNFQGRIASKDGLPITVPTLVGFEIYQDGDELGGGTLVFKENATVQPNSQGIFTHLLGSGKVLLGTMSPETFSATTTYLQITVNPNTQADILKPRQQLTTVSYAFSAENAKKADNAKTADNAAYAENAGVAANAKSVDDDSISTAKIKDKAVTSQKLSDDAIYTDQKAIRAVEDSGKFIKISTEPATAGMLIMPSTNAVISAATPEGKVTIENDTNVKGSLKVGQHSVWIGNNEVDSTATEIKYTGATGGALLTSEGQQFIIQTTLNANNESGDITIRTNSPDQFTPRHIILQPSGGGTVQSMGQTNLWGPVLCAVDNKTKLHINRGGVGIGLLMPKSALNVAGNTQLTPESAIRFNNSEPNWSIIRTTNTQGVIWGGPNYGVTSKLGLQCALLVTIFDSDSQGFIVANNFGNSLFEISGGTGEGSKVYLRNNVGIGTNNPQNKLDVNGWICSYNGFKVIGNDQQSHDVINNDGQWVGDEISVSNGGTGLNSPGTVGNILRSTGGGWESWTPNYLTQIVNDAIGNAQMADNAINTAEIQDNAVTSAKIAAGAVTNAKITGPISVANGGTGLSMISGTAGDLLKVNSSATGWEVGQPDYVKDATNNTLIRSGNGTVSDSYKLGLNLTNANIWTGEQTLSGGAKFPGSGIWNTSGNVGIGTSSPNEKLSVNGNIEIPTGNYIYFCSEQPLENRWMIGRVYNPVGAKICTQFALRAKIYGDNTIEGFMISNNRDISLFEIRGSDGQTYINGTVGIGTASPGQDKLDVRGRCYSSGGWQTTDGDYAEWFEKEEDAKAGDIIGLNLDTGKVRKYKQGDKFIGIYSGAPAFVGNRIKETENEMMQTHLLVGLLGQLDFNKDQTVTNGRIVKTLDGKEIGILLSNGKILIGR